MPHRSSLVSSVRRFALPEGPQWIAARGSTVDVELRLQNGAESTRIDQRWMASAPEVAFIDAAAGATLEVHARFSSTSSAAVEVVVRRAAPGADALFGALRDAVDAGRSPHAAARAGGVDQLVAVAERLDAAGEAGLATFARTESAVAAYELGRRDARSRLERARDAAMAANQPADAAKAHLFLGQLMQDFGLSEVAMVELDRARALAPIDLPLRVRRMTIASEVLRYGGRTVESHALARKVSALADRLNDARLISDAKAALAWTHVRMGAKAEATSAFEASLEAAKASGDQRRLGLALHHMGIIHSNLEYDWETALTYYERAIALREQLGDLNGLAFSLDAAGEVQSTLKRPAAIARHHRALELRRAVGNRRGQAQTLTSLGNALSRLGRSAEAVPYLEEGAQRMGEIGDAHYEGYAYFRLGRAYHHLARYPDAVAAARKALSIAESFRSRIGTETGRTGFSDSVRWYYDLFVSAAGDQFAVDGRRRWVAAALEASERARAQSLVETIGKVDVPRDVPVPAAQIATHERLRQAILRLEAAQKLDRATGGTPERIAAREAEIVAYMTKFAQIMRRIDRMDPRRSALMSTPIVTLDEAQAMLDGADRLVVEFYLGAGGAYAIAIGTATAAVAALGSERPLNAQARRAHTLLTARNAVVDGESATSRAARIQASDAAATEALKMLRTQLFGGLEPLLDAHRRIVIVADKALHYLPFAAVLPDHEVATLPSLTVLKAQRSRGLNAPRRRLAAIGDPVFGPDDPRLIRGPALAALDGVRGASLRERAEGLPRLRFAGPEVDAIAALVPPQDRVVKTGFDATKAWVVSGVLEPFAYVHFATHGILDAAEPVASGLALSQRDVRGQEILGFLTLNDVYQLRLNADLVTLSACETALGKEVVSEGLIGLTRGFLHAGARRVVASLWKVNDRATRELMTELYRGLLQDKLPAAAALRRAQQILAQNPRYEAPVLLGRICPPGRLARPTLDWPLPSLRGDVVEPDEHVFDVFEAKTGGVADALGCCGDEQRIVAEHAAAGEGGRVAIIVVFALQFALRDVDAGLNGRPRKGADLSGVRHLGQPTIGAPAACAEWIDEQVSRRPRRGDLRLRCPAWVAPLTRKRVSLSNL
ncbi:MAG: CHAT domain-containing protein [Myxococcota bacterium]